MKHDKVLFRSDAGVEFTANEEVEVYHAFEWKPGWKLLDAVSWAYKKGVWLYRVQPLPGNNADLPLWREKRQIRKPQPAQRPRVPPLAVLLREVWPPPHFTKLDQAGLCGRSDISTFPAYWKDGTFGTEVDCGVHKDHQSKIHIGPESSWSAKLPMLMRGEQERLDKLEAYICTISSGMWREDVQWLINLVRRLELRR